MKYLLDTCVLSELIKPLPNPEVVNWITAIDESYLNISVLTIGELHEGIEQLPVSKKKDSLHKWVAVELQDRFNHKILDIDIDVAVTWGKVQAKSELIGQTLPAIDGLIASTGITHDLTIVTRNIKNMSASGCSLLNPWE